jgi:hypothetical protein
MTFKTTVLCPAPPGEVSDSPGFAISSAANAPKFSKKQNAATEKNRTDLFILPCLIHQPLFRAFLLWQGHKNNPHRELLRSRQSLKIFSGTPPAMRNSGTASSAAASLYLYYLPFRDLPRPARGDTQFYTFFRRHRKKMSRNFKQLQNTRAAVYKRIAEETIHETVLQIMVCFDRHPFNIEFTRPRAAGLRRRDAGELWERGVRRCEKKADRRLEHLGHKKRADSRSAARMFCY